MSALAAATRVSRRLARLPGMNAGEDARSAGEGGGNGFLGVYSTSISRFRTYSQSNLGISIYDRWMFR